MAVDVRDFLKEIGFQELLERKILSPWKREDVTYFRLNGNSYTPLLNMMNQVGVTRLEQREHDWYLTSDGKFKNPNSKEVKEGRVSELSTPRHVFRHGFETINPYYYGSPATEASDDSTELPPNYPVPDEPQLKFGLERDLQCALRANIEQLESGLRIIDGGTEKTVDAGRIDITAKDSENRVVVIELKAGTSQLRDIAQLLSYMGSIDNAEGWEIRGILVANDFDDRLVLAAQAVPNISLKAYSFSFSFEDR